MTKIIIKPKQFLNGETTEEQIIALPHPKTQIPVRYLIQKPQLLQLIKVNDSYKKGSWFINNNIVKDGAIYLATPFDLVFLAIPKSEYLGKYLLMDDILDLFSEYHFPILISSLGPQMKHAIRSICHELDSSPSFFRFDESLLLKIMKTKVKKVASHLPKSIELEAITKNFMDNIQEKELNDEKKADELEKIIQLARIKTAMQLINNYLPVKYANLLLQSEDFTPLSSYLQKLQIHRASTSFIQNINHFGTDYCLKKDTIPKEKNKNKRGSENNNTRVQKKMDTKQINKITSFFKTQNKN